MKASALAEEVAALRKEVADLRQKNKSSNATQKVRAKKQPQAANPTEAEIKKMLKDVLSQVKKDYEHLSPVSAVLLFGLGAVLGGMLSRGKGGAS